MKKVLRLILSVILTFGIFCGMPYMEIPFEITTQAASVDDLSFRLNDCRTRKCGTCCANIKTKYSYRNFLETKDILSSGHVFGEWKMVVAATCTEPGEKVRFCVNCNIAEYEIVTATGHDYSRSWTLDIPPTCTSNGSKSHHCLNCGDKTEITVVNPKPHKFSEWEIVKKPTYTSYGQKVSYCDVCYTAEYAIIPMLKCATPKLSNVTNVTSGIKVEWKTVVGADTYRVFRKIGSGKWNMIAKDLKIASYTDTNVNSGTTYTYTVRAKSGYGLSDYDTAGISMKYLKTPEITDVASVTEGVKVKWSAVKGADSYRVFRKVGSSKWTVIAMDLKTTSYTDNDVKSGMTYKYTIRAKNEYGLSDYNATGVALEYLETPDIVSVSNTTRGINVTWKAVDGADNYRVFRKVGSGKWTVIAMDLKTTSYTDTKVESGVTYRYTIRAKNGYGLSDFDAVGIYLKYRVVPKILNIKNRISGIYVEWTSVDDADSYRVFRKVGSGKWTVIAMDLKTTSYTDTKVKSGVTYRYTVRTKNEEGLSDYDKVGASLKRLKTPILKSVSSEKSGVTLKWNKVKGASGYMIYRLTGTENWVKIATVKGNSKVSYIDKKAKKGTLYYYTVKAYYGKTYSIQSNVENIKVKY